MNAPGSHRVCEESWGAFEKCAQGLEAGVLCIADERVLKLHPAVRRTLKGTRIIALKAAERTKSMAQLNALANDAPRACSAVLVVGGGTLGDLGTVLAHLIRRGVPLIQVPTTLLAAVDSSVGGKGAVHARAGGQWLKNAWGVYHYAERAWLCPELWETLSDDQRRQGAIEAFKMDVTLDARGLERWAGATPPADMVPRARELKARVCAEDPYDSGGVRRVLNFGHTFGHAFETLTRFRLAHGDAVGLGMLRALDIGASLGVTPRSLAAEIEAGLQRIGAPQRRRMTALLTHRQLNKAIAGDKKGASLTGANMVLLEKLGRARTQWVEW